MESGTPKRWWRITRICFRGVRIAVLLAVLILVVVLSYLNTIGLPDWAKRPLVAKLHDRGLDIEFTRLRWRWYRGLVADHVILVAAQQETNSPLLSMQQLELKINHHELVRFRLQIDSVVVHNGRLVWPLNESNQPPASLSMTNIQTQLRFLPGDQWALDHFTASFAGAKLQLAGSLANASELRNLTKRKRPSGQPSLLRARLRELSRIIDEIHFDKPPELDVIVNGDARDVRSFNGSLTLDAPGAATPWGTLTNGTLFVRVIAPADTNSLPHLKSQLHTDEVQFEIHPSPSQTIAGSTKHFHVDLDAYGDETISNLVHARLEISVHDIASPWGQATNAHFIAQWTHSLTNPVPLSGSSEFKITAPQTRWGGADEIVLTSSLSQPVSDTPPKADASWAWWAALEPYFLDWNCRVEKVRAGDFQSEQVVCAGNWRAPELLVTNLHTEMYQGHFDGGAKLDVATRLASFAFISDFDVQKASPLLTPGARDWIERQEFSWEKPPLFHGTGSIQVPEWTNAHPNWRGEVLPTLYLYGDFEVGAGGYRGIQFTSAHSHISYTNMVWMLPDLVATRPEGTVELAHVSDDKTRDYYFRFLSTTDIKIVRHLLATNVQRGLDYFNFTQPPRIEAEVWGRWHEHDRTGFKGQVTITNFTFRTETATYFQTSLEYTNRFLLMKNVRVERTNQYLTAASLGLDFPEKRGYLTNGFSTLDPMAFCRCIGPKVARDMEPYHFLQPPTIKVEGTVPISDDTRVADLHFNLDGGPFEWYKFHLPHVAGTVNWLGDHLTFNDMQAGFYEGKMTGSAGFDFTRKAGTDFHFDTVLTGGNLHALMSDLTPKTNHLEGVLNGHLNISHANSADTNSWNGKGAVDLHDGLIWEIPLFGVLSPALDSISPGLGKTRAKDGLADFTITNSILHSENLEIRSPTIRLLYKGDIGLADGKVNATVEAEVGRDTPLVGPLVGVLFSPFGKLFETKVSGTLENPKREPVVFMVKWLSPTHWWNALRGLFPSNEPNYNGPAPAQPIDTSPPK